jgi:4a-hydroxytetrahydrobiopterin dehydratase
MDLLDTAAIERELIDTPGWQRAEDAIVKTATFADFKEAIEFVNRVADAAEEAGHHPDIDIRWNKVTLLLTTHAAGGLTTNDFNLARHLNDL